MKKRIPPIILMILCWSAYFIISDQLITRLGNVFISGFFLRIVVFILFLAGLGFTLKIRTLKVHNKIIFFKLLLIGLLGFLQDAFAFLGFQYSSVEVGTILLKTDILIANMITILFLKQHFSLQDWIFSIIMLLGVFLVLNINIKALSFNYYDLFFLLSALIVTLNAFLVKSVQNKHRVESNVISFYNNSVVVCCFLAMSFITVGVNWFSAINIGTSLLVALAITGGIMQCGIYIYYYSNLKSLPVWIVKITLLLIPVVTSILGVVLFNTVLTAKIILGMTIVIIGAIGLLLKQRNIINIKSKES